MTVLIDPPIWPRHDRLWGHLISDTSLDELHATASAAGIPARAFDRDHYDVPTELQTRLIELGAVPVSGHELIRRLRASGLRVTSGERRTGVPVESHPKPAGEVKPIRSTHDEGSGPESFDSGPDPSSSQ